MATDWQPAIQEEIAEAMKNPVQSGSKGFADLHKWVQSGLLRKSQGGVT
jgi:hypothetical protein